MKERIRVPLIAAVILAAVLGIFALPPISQSQAYHNFADRRGLLGLPNVLNVISNAGFFLVGALGLRSLVRRGGSDLACSFAQSAERWPYGILFLGIALTALGSGYYHLAPDNARLVWDRLPMTMGFTAIVSALIAERIGLKVGLWSLPPLVAAGIGSVVYWYATEANGRGDLRPYVLVQFFPVLAIPLLMLLFPPRYTRSADLLRAAALYALAKLFEALDTQVYAFGRIVSGHTLKHVAAALAAYQILRMLQRRQPLPARPGCGSKTPSVPGL